MPKRIDETMLVLFLKLFLAHILGDFVLQPSNLVEKRNQNVMYLLLHVLIHGAILCLLFVTELSTFWITILFIVVAHLAIDSLKIWIEKKGVYKPVLLFCLDQAMHLSVLAGVLVYTYGISYSVILSLYSVQNLMYLIAFLLITVVTPIFLRVFFSTWNNESEFVNKRKESLLNAGMLIGIMERLIIVLFIQVGFLSGIGFLLAAKSIFRFGDLTNAKDTKFTEYIVVGTFASFLIAIVVGYLLQFGLKSI